MNRQEKEKLQKELLELTHFQDVLGQYYIVIDALTWRQWLEVPAPVYSNTAFKIGSYRINISDFHKILSTLPGSGLPLHVVQHLLDLICISIQNEAILHLFQLLEKERLSPEEASPSILQLLAYLKTPDSRKIIDKLHGNSDKNLSSLEKQINKLWEQHGKSAYVFRNHFIHGRVLLSDPKSKAWSDVMGNEQSSRDFYKTIDGVYDILNFVSKTCFGEKKNLPTKKEFVESIWDGTPGKSVWCFDMSKFPTKYDYSDIPHNILTPE